MYLHFISYPLFIKFIQTNSEKLTTSITYFKNVYTISCYFFRLALTLTSIFFTICTLDSPRSTRNYVLLVVHQFPLLKTFFRSSINSINSFLKISFSSSVSPFEFIRKSSSILSNPSSFSSIFPTK